MAIDFEFSSKRGWMYNGSHNTRFVEINLMEVKGLVEGCIELFPVDWESVLLVIGWVKKIGNWMLGKVADKC